MDVAKFCIYTISDHLKNVEGDHHSVCRSSTDGSLQYNSLAWLGSKYPGYRIFNFKKTLMKILNLFFIGLILVCLQNCKKSETEIISKSDSLNVKTDTLVEPEIHKELYGLYSGEFTADQAYTGDMKYEEIYKKITLKINRITKDSVYGQSVVNGNQRSFRGVFNENSKKFTLDEPGSDNSDGRFQININGDSLTGSWKAFKTNEVKIASKKLKLIKKEFVYNANFMLEPNPDDESDNGGVLVDWSNPKIKKESYTNENGKTETYDNDVYRSASPKVLTINASKQKLTEKDLKNLRKLDIEIIKNTVFARHGYSFKKQTFRNFFESTDWYVPVSNNVDADLSPLELENVALLNRFTKYAEDKYDSFGR